MYYLSTRNNELKESFSHILFQGLSKDGGLFLPTTWPLITMENLKGKNYQEIAHEIIRPFVTNDISDENLDLIVRTTETFNEH